MAYLAQVKLAITRISLFENVFDKFIKPLVPHFGSQLATNTRNQGDLAHFTTQCYARLLLRGEQFKE
ncbi:hypothetical protein GCHA_1372 [Paraglaciecola chathamensis S18K6]|uniref:Uncharacterized protein n=1 Tax=Paraglaciecola chathamensis S18K6 TaxID=1127672 RepID=A0AAV3UW22_9ALTE|nr:hypothetical protein GCHA_1372 [Paraglaciecola chathamensis S18K6]